MKHLAQLKIAENQEEGIECDLFCLTKSTWQLTPHFMLRKWNAHSNIRHQTRCPFPLFIPKIPQDALANRIWCAIEIKAVRLWKVEQNSIFSLMKWTFTQRRPQGQSRKEPALPRECLSLRTEDPRRNNFSPFLHSADMGAEYRSKLLLLSGHQGNN